MISNLLFKLIIFLLICLPAYASDNISSFDPNNIGALNDILNSLDSKINGLKSGFNINNLTGILTVDHGGTGQDSSNWTSGDLIYMSNTGVWGHAPFNTFDIHGNTTFTGSGTFVVPAGINIVYITEIGGGGGGGTSGGGFGGAYIINYPFVVTPLSSYSVTIGGAGAGRIDGASEATNGGSTSFSTISVAGGTSGNGVSGVGGIDGSTSTGGGFSQKGGLRGTTGGAGSPFGIGGTGGLSFTAGTGYGSGGGSDFVSGTANGGNGAPGLCIVIY